MTSRIQPGSFDAVIFDLDGVIVDSEPRHERAFMQVFEEMGFGEGRHGMDFSAYVGRSDRALWEDFMAKHRPPQPIEELIAWKQNRVVALLREERPIYPGLRELVKELGTHFRLAVASGSVHAVIEAVLELAGLREAFEVVASVQDVRRSKPAPDVFLDAAARLQVEPRRCCVIEDSLAGIRAGRDAGMTVIAVPHSYPADRLLDAHHVVRGLDEIAPLLLGRR
ncbi:MAG: HAD family phosphatase [Verrucomicrobiae bacterium]|nr:HAD family phosphatase [Verrucomicrobiae bacterium]